MIKLFGGARREDGLFSISMGIDPTFTYVRTEEDRVEVESTIENLVVRLSEWDDDAERDFLDYLIYELFPELIDIVRIKQFVADAKHYAELAVEQDGHKGFYFLYLWREFREE